MKRTHILVCTGTGCTSAGSFQTRDALLEEIRKRGLGNEVEVIETGCMGRCDLGPVSMVHPDGTFYKNVKAPEIPQLVEFPAETFSYHLAIADERGWFVLQRPFQ